MLELFALLAVIFFVFVIPVIVFSLLGRVRRLEEELVSMRIALGKREQKITEGAGAKESPPLAEKPVESPSEKPLEKPEESPVVRPSLQSGPPARPQPPHQEEVNSVPPALPVAPQKTAELAVAQEEKKEKAEAIENEPTPPTSVAGPSPLSEWLQRMGLQPPSAEDEEANPMAWWSTRVGLAFGVIAAVFLGMYVNQDTVPWVRLLELVAVAVAVFAGGCYLERKVANFGRALSAGGLALLYVSAYAAYGLPAMKVVASPLVGTLLQAGALALTAGWALLRGREAIFGLAIALGYLTCCFAASEDLHPVPLVALVILSVAGTSLFALRNWWSGLWGAVIGSGLGLAVLGTLTWSISNGPSLVVALATMQALTILPLIALCYRWAQGEERAKAVVPMVTSVGLLSGAIVTGVRGFDFEPFYASFAVLLFLAGWWWRRDDREGIWQTLWAKGMGLVALLLISHFDGPVRAFALLAQAGGLVWLSRTRGRVVFELGAAFVGLVGWFFLWADTSVVSPWLGGRGFLILYLVLAQALLIFHRRLLGENLVRRVAAVFCSVLVALEVINVSVWREPQLWLVAVPFGFALLTLVQRWPLRLKDAEWTPYVTLVGVATVLSRSFYQDLPVAGQSALWLLFGGAFYLWLSRSQKPRHLFASLTIVAVFLLPYGFLIEQTLGILWLPALFVTLALVWQLVGAHFHRLALRGFALLAGLVGALFFLENGWGEGLQGQTVGLLAAALAWWFAGWKFSGEELMPLKAYGECIRTAIFGLALFAVAETFASGLGLAVVLLLLSSLLLVAWRFLSAEGLSWLSVAFSMLALFKASTEEQQRFFPGVVALFFVLFVAHGIFSAGRREGSSLARPKVASLLWGGLAMLVVLIGLSRSAVVANWTTASWAIAAVALLVAGFWFGLRGYRMIALAGLGATILRLFVVDIQESFWRIVAFGITGALLVGIGYLYNRFHQRLADGDLDWGRGGEKAEEGATED